MRYRNYLIAAFLLFTYPALAQDITGLWKGTLYNDTTRQTLSYEIGISEEKGKLSGFSHTWFILDDKQYYGVKKVKVKQENGKILVEDAGLIAHNYPVAPAKNVKQLNVLTLEVNGDKMFLSGPFSTNRTKEFNSLTGAVKLQRKIDFHQSALIPHLQELGKAEELSFVKEEILIAKKLEKEKSDQEALLTKIEEQRKLEQLNATKKAEEEAIAKIEKVKKEEAIAVSEAVRRKDQETAKNKVVQDSIAYAKAEKAREQEVIAKNKSIQDSIAFAKAESDKKAITIDVNNRKKVDEAIAKKVADDKAKIEAKKKADEEFRLIVAKKEAERIKAQNEAAKRIADKQAADAIVKREADKKEEERKKAMLTDAIVKKEASKNVSTPKATQETIISNNTIPGGAAANVNKRKTELQQIVYFKSDSLQLTLYDNGEVDGDTVSVLMNGNIIFSKERLSTNAVRKTVLIDPSLDSIQLVMYAENLGTIAPNTGLLVVKDGKDIYEIRFSGDLNRNAAIVFKRSR